MKLTYSAVLHPEFTGYVALLKLSSSVKVEEVVGISELSLDNEKNPLKIALELASQCQNEKLSVAPSIAEDSARFQQAFAFAYGAIQDSMRTGHPELTEIFEIMNELLKNSNFLAGNRATAADALLFALLHSRIRALIPSLQRRFFRVIRWFLQMQHEFVDEVLAKLVFPLAAFDLKSIEAGDNSTATLVKDVSKLSLADAKEAKKKRQQEKSDKSITPAPDAPAMARVDLRVGKIVEIEKHPNADRLYIEKVDFGETELRTVVSGLVEHVPIEELQGRLCMFICNLKPATICKVQSSAMLLVGKNETDLQPLIIPAGAKPGDRICVAGIQPQPDAVIKPVKEPLLSVWDEVKKELVVDDQGHAKYGNELLMVVGVSEPIHCTKITNGTIG